jgi:S-DNA-T family DNA segregation ATPase FtsK/SpoIIIE
MADEYFKKIKFNRVVMHLKTIIPITISVDSPPYKEKQNQTSLFLIIGPSLTMGLASSGTALFTIINTLNNGESIIKVMPTIIFSVSILIGAILWPLLSKRSEKKRIYKNEQKRQKSYFEYLDKIRDVIYEQKIEQQQIIKTNLPNLKQCINAVYKQNNYLWCKPILKNKPIELSIGIGNKPLYINLQFPPNKITIDDDVLENAMGGLMHEKKLITNVPIGIDIKVNNIIGAIGNKNLLEKFINNFLLQIFALYSPVDIEIIFFGNTNSKYLHFENSMHFIKDTKNIKEITKLLNDCIDNIKDLTLNSTLQKKYYIIFVENYILAQKTGIIQELLDINSNKFSIIWFCEYKKNLPLQVKKIIDVNSTKSNFILSQIEFDTLQKVYNQLQKIEVIDNTKQYQLPTIVEFSKIIKNKIGIEQIKYNHTNNSTIKSLKAPIGIDTFGEILELDLHQNENGPHGLIAGTTGSGKSELLISYILSMALNYSPEYLSFLLIDYKGGGLSNAFYDSMQDKFLPHISGIITNLDGEQIKRALLSINAENTRRQKIFNYAKHLLNEPIMDIYKYQMFYSKGKLKDPLSHLIIIVDEFAELKVKEPDFIDFLISTARIGRSLGVHLILSTQKPSMSVSDEIWSNSKFKIALKVQDKNDSLEVIKKENAANIKNAGRFFLSIGNNELFIEGQSAYVGSNLLNYVKNIISATNVNSNQLFLPELSKNIEYKAEYKNAIGIADIPEKQLQKLVKFNICSGNTIIYGSLNIGKTNLIETIINVNSANFEFYIIDFANKKALKQYKNYYTVQSIIEINNLFSHLNSLSINKKKLVIIINNFSLFWETFENLQTEFESIVRECVKNNIYFIITASSTNSINYRISEHFSQIICFTLNDKMDYSYVLGKNPKFTPNNIKGRAILKNNDKTVLFQTFLNANNANK